MLALGVETAMHKDPDKILRHFPTLLQRWKGCIARLWELTTSHPTLILRIEQQERHGNLQISCIGPIHIQGPTECKNCIIQVERYPKGGFLITDENAGVKIHSEMVEISENRKPYNVSTASANSDNT